MAFSEVYRIFAERGLQDRVTWIASGKLGLPDNVLVAFALGADMVHVAREAMLAIGCIQAQKCHTDHCPAGVATQNAWLARGLEPVSKAERLARYVQTLRRDLLKVAEAAGVRHPGALGPWDVDILEGTRSHRALGDLYGYEPGWGVPDSAIMAAIDAIMATPPDRGERDVVQHEPLETKEDPGTAVE